MCLFLKHCIKHLMLIVQQYYVEVVQSYRTKLGKTWLKASPNPPSQGLQNAQFLVFVSISIICMSPREKSGLY